MLEVTKPLLLFILTLKQECFLWVQTIPVFDYEPARLLSAASVKLLNQQTLQVLDFKWQGIRTTLVYEKSGSDEPKEPEAGSSIAKVDLFAETLYPAVL